MRDGWTLLADYTEAAEAHFREFTRQFMDVMKVISAKKPAKVARVVSSDFYANQLNQMSTMTGYQGADFIRPAEAEQFLDS